MVEGQYIAMSTLGIDYLSDIIKLSKLSPSGAVEWNLNYLPATLDFNRVKNLKNLISTGKLYIRYHLPYSYIEIGHLRPDIQEYSVLAILRNLDFIHSMNGTEAVMHIGYFQGSIFEICLKNLSTIARYADQKGIKICIENLTKGITVDINNLKKLLTIPNTYLCLDTGHAYILQKSIPRYIDEMISLSEHIIHSHVYFSIDNQYNHIPFKEKNLRESMLITCLKASNCGWFTMELETVGKQVSQSQLVKKFINH